MDAGAKRQAIQDYKERKLPMGVYAIRCALSGQVWVGQSKNLNAVTNRLWFSLQLGGHHSKSLQAAYAAHGRDAFTFEVLETLSDEATEFPDANLSELLKLWREELQAELV